MSKKILIFSEKPPTMRLQYIAKVLFTDLYGFEIIFTSQRDIFWTADIPKFSYADFPISDEIFVKKHTLLLEKSTITYNFQKISDFGFDTEGGGDFLAASFFMLSRYEEYAENAENFDNHNRFKAAQSLAFRENMLQKPIVNQWVMQFLEKLKKRFPYLEITPTQYRFLPTFDIDMAFQYRHKGILRNIGGLLRDVKNGDKNAIIDRLKILSRLKPDPDFEALKWIISFCESKNLDPIFFWLLGDLGTYDKNIDWQNIDFQNIIKNIAKRFSVGIHPSYKSNEHIKCLEIEKNRLAVITNEPILRGRQHFLKLRFPETYRRYLQVGITEDYTLGYADAIGFRAGIATPFYWYDLENEAITDLKIMPMNIMDVTLKDYLRYSPDEAIAESRKLIAEIQAVGGTFVSLWHNSTLTDTGEWQDWKRVFCELSEGLLDLRF